MHRDETRFGQFLPEDTMCCPALPERCRQFACDWNEVPPDCGLEYVMPLDIPIMIYKQRELSDSGAETAPDHIGSLLISEDIVTLRFRAVTEAQGEFEEVATSFGGWNDHVCNDLRYLLAPTFHRFGVLVREEHDTIGVLCRPRANASDSQDAQYDEEMQPLPTSEHLFHVLTFTYTVHTGNKNFKPRCALECLESVIAIGAELWLPATSPALQTYRERLPSSADPHHSFLVVRVSYPTARQSAEIDDTKAYVSFLSAPRHIPVDGQGMSNASVTVAVDPSELCFPGTYTDVTLWRSIHS
jgi:hypothetical protein